MKIVELCSGIGGLGLPFLEEGFDLELAVDFDKECIKSYKANISEKVMCASIRAAMKEIPTHDILLASTPCQSWSLAGKLEGFYDDRGLVFFDVLDVIRVRQPKVILLENVASLIDHDNGESFRHMLQCLNVFGYSTSYQVLDSQDFGVPQRRKRVFIVCFHKKYFKNIPFQFPKGEKLTITLQDILDEEVESNYFLTEEVKQYVLDVPSNKNGDLSKVPINQKVAKTLLTSSGTHNKCTKNNYVTDDKNAIDPKKSNLRRLTPSECLKLQGFDAENWKYVVSDTQLYKQTGNAVTVSVSRALAKSIKKYIEKNFLRKQLYSNKI
ncbi:DNA cytosine methyltransferase [Enterococcus sp. BWR-S5]|uniref:DNA cytosine methyltransferase n=1 Tax=Enterococcus sp. BWR-S5 TaxID=2787714 RepID=UPI0019215A79|nr:DNA cytosine methyltransferase [Enterococcus sp. BWR-S5]MBL1225848.1 DNA (cytosine-5-)-methyltransferase [Enterococcus sp. BWR-S5]